MHFRIFPPHPALSDFVSRFWVMSSQKSEAGVVHPVIPNGRVKMMFNFADDFLLDYEDSHEKLLRAPTLVGQMSRPALVTSTGQIGVIGVEFHPFGAAPFFNLDQREILRQVPYLAELNLKSWHSDLNDRFRELKENSERVNLLQQVMLRHIQKRSLQLPQKIERIRSILHELKSSGRLVHSAESHGISYRTFERLHTQYVGLSPKELQKIFQVQNLFSIVQKNPGCTWAVYAAEAGYSDQAHMIRHFRSLTGCTPVQFMKRMTELTANFANTREI
ncbi:MAG: AraC family transcriptional regulator [Leptospiraceae bacterium]|nr:AraC family transcriptional regulator [Leptospiraceae bacterium]